MLLPLRNQLGSILAKAVLPKNFQFQLALPVLPTRNCFGFYTCKLTMKVTFQRPCLWDGSDIVVELESYIEICNAIITHWEPIQSGWNVPTPMFSEWCIQLIVNISYWTATCFSQLHHSQLIYIQVAHTSFSLNFCITVHFLWLESAFISKYFVKVQSFTTHNLYKSPQIRDRYMKEHIW